MESGDRVYWGNGRWWWGVYEEGGVLKVICSRRRHCHCHWCWHCCSRWCARRPVLPPAHLLAPSLVHCSFVPRSPFPIPRSFIVPHLFNVPCLFIVPRLFVCRSLFTFRLSLFAVRCLFIHHCWCQCCGCGCSCCCSFVLLSLPPALTR